jgi:molybdopterin-guanine dinucleotide biosynthesis protein B
VASTRTAMIGIAGWKNSGKTTLVSRLVQAFTKRGFKIATIKHAHHDLRPNDGTTDSERHLQAGACNVAVVTPTGWEISGQSQDLPVPSLEEIAMRLAPADLVLVEGYKSARIPKIELRRSASATDRPLADNDTNVIAIASDLALEDRNVPVFALDDVEGIAAFIEKATNLARQSRLE